MESGMTSTGNRQTEVSDAKKNVDSSIDRLRELVGGMEDRLSSVLHLRSETATEKPIPENSTALAQDIQQFADKVNRTCDDIESVTSRLEL